MNSDALTDLSLEVGQQGNQIRVPARNLLHYASLLTYCLPFLRHLILFLSPKITLEVTPVITKIFFLVQQYPADIFLIWENTEKPKTDKQMASGQSLNESLQVKCSRA